MKLHGSGTFIKALKHTRKFAKKYDAPMKWYLVMLIIYAGTTVTLPLITVYVIDALVAANDFVQFLIFVALFFLINILKAVLRGVINIYTCKREFQYEKELERISMERFFEKKGEFYIKNKTGDMMEVILNDNMEVAAFTYQVYRTIADLINSFAVLAMLIYLQWDLALILMACVPFILIIQNNLEWKLDKHYEMFRDDMAQESSLTEEFVSNAALIISHGIKEKCKKKYTQILKRLIAIYKKIVLLSHISFGVLECFIILAISIAVAYEGYKIFMGTATIGILVAFIQYSDFLIEPGRLLATLRVQGNKIIPSITKVEKIYETEDYNKDRDMPDFENYDIEFKNVGFSYPSGKKIFQNVHVKMESKKTHIIVGASGQGKTTMIHLITGLWDAMEGTLNIGGHCVKNINLDYLRKHISLVSQDNLFFNETIRNNLMEEENQYADDELWAALKKAGMLREVMEMPNRLDTVLGDRGYMLSGGQRQRLAIARALLKDAPIIIFDEPTSALDEETEQTILDTIRSLKDKTIIVITHRKSLMGIGDYIYEINNQSIRLI